MSNPPAPSSSSKPKKKKRNKNKTGRPAHGSILFKPVPASPDTLPSSSAAVPPLDTPPPPASTSVDNTFIRAAHPDFRTLDPNQLGTKRTSDLTRKTQEAQTRARTLPRAPDGSPALSFRDNKKLQHLQQRTTAKEQARSTTTSSAPPLPPFLLRILSPYTPPPPPRAPDLSPEDEHARLAAHIIQHPHPPRRPIHTVGHTEGKKQLKTKDKSLPDFNIPPLAQDQDLLCLWREHGLAPAVGIPLREQDMSTYLLPPNPDHFGLLNIDSSSSTPAPSPSLTALDSRIHSSSPSRQMTPSPSHHSALTASRSAELALQAFHEFGGPSKDWTSLPQPPTQADIELRFNLDSEIAQQRSLADLAHANSVSFRRGGAMEVDDGPVAGPSRLGGHGDF